MREMAMTLNQNGIVISKDLFDKTYNKYVSLFMKACYRLYDLGFLKSCSEFSESELRSSYFSYFRDSIKLFESYNSGSLMFNWKIADLAILTGNLGDDFKQVTTYVRDILKYKSAVDALDTAYSRLSMKKKHETLVYPKILVSSVIENCSQVPLDNFALQECFYRNPNTHLTSIDTRDILIEVVCKHIGVSDEDYNQHKSTGQAFFIDGITSKQELEFIDYIISGNIKLTGKFGTRLNDFIKNYYKKHTEQWNDKISCVKFENIIFNESIELRCEKVRQKCKEVKINNGREFYVTNDSAVFEVPDLLYSEKKYFFDDGFTAGNYVLDYSTGLELDKVNCLLGLSGEYISKEDVQSLGYSAFGKPILMHNIVKTNRNTIKDTLKEYYPIYNVSAIPNLKKMDEIRSYSLKPHIGRDIQFVFSVINNVYQQFGVQTKEDLFKTIRSLVLDEYDLLVGASKNVGRRSYSSLVADLVCSLIFMDCGYPDYELCFNSYEWVTDDIYLTACYDACTKLIQYYG